MTHEHKACYGTMFHDTLHFKPNRGMKGKVFSFELESMGLGHDPEKWDLLFGKDHAQTKI